MRTAPSVCLGLIGLLVAEVPVHAYLDPGSSSLLLQGIVGAIAAGIVVLKAYWQRISRACRRSGGPHDRHDGPTA